MAKGNSSEIRLRIYGYKVGKEWAAHCLETDLVGRGKNFAQAMDELRELTEMQVSFAIQTDQPSLLDHPAPPEIWQAYERATRDYLCNLFSKRIEPQTLGSLGLSGNAGQGKSLAWCGA
jgi:hypothetical protein